MFVSKGIWTHYSYYDKDEKLIYHAIGKGTTTNTVEEIYNHYSNALLLNIPLELKEDPDDWLNIEYDWFHDHRDSDKLNCVEYGKILFGIDNIKCKYPNYMIKYSDKKYKI